MQRLLYCVLMVALGGAGLTESPNEVSRSSSLPQGTLSPGEQGDDIGSRNAPQRTLTPGKQEDDLQLQVAPPGTFNASKLDGEEGDSAPPQKSDLLRKETKTEKEHVEKPPSNETVKIPDTEAIKDNDDMNKEAGNDTVIRNTTETDIKLDIPSVEKKIWTNFVNGEEAKEKEGKNITENETLKERTPNTSTTTQTQTAAKESNDKVANETQSKNVSNGTDEKTVDRETMKNNNHGDDMKNETAAEEKVETINTDRNETGDYKNEPQKVEGTKEENEKMIGNRTKEVSVTEKIEKLPSNELIETEEKTIIENETLRERISNNATVRKTSEPKNITDGSENVINGTQTEKTSEPKNTTDGSENVINGTQIEKTSEPKNIIDGSENVINGTQIEKTSEPKNITDGSENVINGTQIEKTSEPKNTTDGSENVINGTQTEETSEPKNITDGSENVINGTQTEKLPNGTVERTIKREVAKKTDQGSGAENVTVTEKKGEIDNIDKNETEAKEIEASAVDRKGEGEKEKGTQKITEKFIPWVDFLRYGMSYNTWNRTFQGWHLSWYPCTALSFGNTCTYYDPRKDKFATIQLANVIDLVLSNWTLSHYPLLKTSWDMCCGGEPFYMTKGRYAIWHMKKPCVMPIDIESRAERQVWDSRNKLYPYYKRTTRYRIPLSQNLRKFFFSDDYPNDLRIKPEYYDYAKSLIEWSKMRDSETDHIPGGKHN